VAGFFLARDFRAAAISASICRMVVCSDFLLGFLLECAQEALKLSEPHGAQGICEDTALGFSDLIPPKGLPYQFTHGAVLALGELLGPPPHLWGHGD
jgi:hypothetical protein